MQIVTKKIKLFGKVETMFQVIDKDGEVLQVACTKEEAQEWINNQSNV